MCHENSKQALDPNIIYIFQVFLLFCGTFNNDNLVSVITPSRGRFSVDSTGIIWPPRGHCITVGLSRQISKLLRPIKSTKEYTTNAWSYLDGLILSICSTLGHVNNGNVHIHLCLLRSPLRIPCCLYFVFLASRQRNVLQTDSQTAKQPKSQTAKGSQGRYKSQHGFPQPGLYGSDLLLSHSISMWGLFATSFIFHENTWCVPRK